MQAEQIRDRFRADALEYFALSPQADTEAELARAVKMRTRHLHCDTYQAAADAAEQARWRTAHHLLQTRLATVRAMPVHRRQLRRSVWSRPGGPTGRLTLPADR
ncbi:DNA-binding transcriptional regulator YiaG [Streptomyces aurantiacus]|uniref:hypothetical protein n=1 Tax=Streptomyces aurantiacus TaxID=47760 RepID=UPI0027903C3F|nr:hypothetical protein [Streptomyces aurantiacus]MDQ0779867.1 DNA-binding transcriptional regulator YiaG [Streptomyces aurantiacus]